MNKQQFSQLLFDQRRRPDDFDMVIRFSSKHKSTVQLQELMFYSCITIHSLDLEKQYSAAIADILPGSSINVQQAVDQLAEYFDSQVFLSQYSHCNLTMVTKELSTIVQQYFQHYLCFYLYQVGN